MVWTNPDVLWLHDGKSVYRWVASGTDQPELIISTDTFIHNIVEVSDDVVWIVASDSIWAYGNNKLDQVTFSWDKFPIESESLFRNVLIDRPNSRIYVITEFYIFSTVFSVVLR